MPSYTVTMVSEERGVLRYGAILALVLLVASVVYLIVVHQLGIETEVIRDRFWKNAEPLFNGEIPIMEYPPLALVFMAIPRFFGDTPWSYNTAYVAEVLVFLVIGLYFTTKLAERFGHSQKRAMLLYAVLMLVMVEFVLDRYDIFPAIITLASFYFFCTRRYALAFVLLAVGTLTKLYPAILFPLFVICLAYERQWRDMVVGVVSFVVTGLVVVGIVWIIEPDMILNFLTYHEDRPLQLESVASSIIYLFSMFGLVTATIQPFAENDFGSDNLIGPVPDAVAGALTPLMVLLIVVLYILYIYLRRCAGDLDMRILALAIVAALMIFMVVNKVFSSQYLIWAILPVVFAAMAVTEGRFGRRLFVSFLVTLLLTQLNFAYNAGYLAGDINDLGMMIILLRNVVAVYVTCIVIGEMVRIARPAAESTEDAGARRIISRHAR